MNLKEKYFDLVMIFTLSFALLLTGICDGFAAAEEVRDNCLRLHILADSDSEEAQSVKLLVRDAVLEVGAKIFTENINSEEAAQKILENKDVLISAANDVIRQNGFDYEAKLTLEEEYFETREYEGITLPAGTYTACKIVLGNGEGKNWWCIMFPPLCLPAAAKRSDDVYAVFGEEGSKLITGEDGYVIKFRIVEIFEEIREKLRGTED